MSTLFWPLFGALLVGAGLLALMFRDRGTVHSEVAYPIDPSALGLPGTKMLVGGRQFGKVLSRHVGVDVANVSALPIFGVRVLLDPKLRPKTGWDA